MNKKYILGFALLGGFAMTSCTGDYDDWADPQSYAQEASVAAYGVSITPGEDADVVMPVANDDVKIAKVAAGASRVNLPEFGDITGFTLRSLTINGQSFNGKIVGNDVIVSAKELDKSIEAQMNSRAHQTYGLTVATSVAANLSNGDAVALQPVETNATLATQPTPAEDPKGYFLLGGFVGNNWDATAPIWMEMEGPGIYSATVTTTSEGDNWYKFYEGSHFESGNWDEINKGQMGCEVNGDKALEGFIVWTGDALYENGVQTPVINGQGTFKVTIDTRNMTYKVTRAEGKYYIIGNPNGWNIYDNSCMAYGEGNNVYSYTTKFTNQWDLKVLEAKYLGTGDAAWGYCWGGENGSTAASGAFFNTDAGAIGPNEAGGWYTFRFDMNSQTYSWTPIDEPSVTYSNISLIGDFNGWGADLDLAALSSAPHNWYSRVTIPSDGGLKFRANHDWGVNWGTANVDLSAKYYGVGIGNGDNIPVPAGTYDVYFNDITGNWNIVVVE